MSNLWISAGIITQPPHDPHLVKEKLLELASKTQQETGCSQFDILEQIDNPGHFTLWECWENEAALNQHFKEPHTTQFLDQGYTKVAYIEKLTMPAQIERAA